MGVVFKKYTDVAGITDDYFRVREFLVGLKCTDFSYTRWDWMATHTYLDKAAVGKIGLWEDDGRIVALATFDGGLGDVYCLTQKGYEYLRTDMLNYAKDNLGTANHYGILIPDEDDGFKRTAAEMGYIATEHKENDSVFLVDETPTDYNLPEGYKIVSMKDQYDLFQYGQVLWNGFDHEAEEGTFEMTDEKEKALEAEMIRPNVDLNLKVAVVNPEGKFVSYCGMWYDENAGFAEIEPVATDPAYRRMGLGKAVVLEGIRRVAELGATKAYVGSSQQFYYSIGLRPNQSATKWICKS